MTINPIGQYRARAALGFIALALNHLAKRVSSFFFSRKVENAPSPKARSYSVIKAEALSKAIGVWKQCKPVSPEETLSRSLMEMSMHAIREGMATLPKGMKVTEREKIKKALRAEILKNVLLFENGPDRSLQGSVKVASRKALERVLSRKALERVLNIAPITTLSGF